MPQRSRQGLLRIATHNVCGFSHSERAAIRATWARHRLQGREEQQGNRIDREAATRSRIFNLVWLWQVVLQLDIVLVQETHINKLADKTDVRSQEWTECALDRAADYHCVSPYTCYWAHGAQGRQGVAILVRTSLLTDPVQKLTIHGVEADPEGRRITMPVSWGGHDFTLLNIYMPQAAQQPAYLQNTCMPWITAQAQGDRSVLLGGDLNMIFKSDANDVRDWLPGLRGARDDVEQQLPLGSDPQAPARTFRTGCERAAMADVFRHLHPHTRAFTCLHQRRCRLLDRFWASNNLLRHISTCSIDPRTLSDHRIMLLQMRPAVQPARAARRARLRLRTDFARTKALVSEFERWVAGMVGQAPRGDHPAMLAWWADSFMPALAEQVRALNKRTKNDSQGWDNAELQAANAALQAAADRFAAVQGATAQSIADLVDAQDRFQQAAQAHNRSAAKKVRWDWLHGNEQVGPHVTRILSRAKAATEIARLNTGAGGITTDPQVMANALARHYAAMSALPAQEDAAARQAALTAVLGALRTQSENKRPRAEQVAAVASHEVTPEEVEEALKGMGRGRAPGPDGVPGHIWRLGGKPMTHLLAAIFTAVGQAEHTPPKFTHGTVAPIHKHNEENREAMASYRPITLLGTAYRVLGRVLSNRFCPALAGAVPDEQTAFLPGRLIADSILFTQLLPAALECEKQGACLASLDFAKAYDTVRRDFLYECMEAVGMGSCVHWVRTLLSDCQATCYVNGCESQPHVWEAGVRQGCPLSPVIYLFVSWALHAWLHTQPAGALGVHVGGKRVVCSQYADDTHVVLPNAAVATVQAFVACMATFATASGQRLNVDKCKLMWIGATAVPAPAPAPGGNPLPPAAALAPPAVGSKVCDMTVVAQVKALGILCDNSNASPGASAAYWTDRVEQVKKTCDKIARLKLSAQGRGLAASCYALSKVLYHCEFMGLPPNNIIDSITHACERVVGTGKGPTDQGRHQGRHQPYIRPTLLTGTPSSGGFGLLPLREHTFARHIKHALRLLTHLTLQSRRPSADLTPNLWARRSAILDQLYGSEMDGIPAAEGMDRTRLERELLLFDHACSRTQTWQLLAQVILQSHYPHFEPAFAIMHLACKSANDDASQTNLPPALRTMIQALRVMAQSNDPARPRVMIDTRLAERLQQSPELAAAAPLWGNPALLTAEPMMYTSPGHNWGGRLAEVQGWVREWASTRFRHLVAPSIACVGNLCTFRGAAVSENWRALTANGGQALWQRLGITSARYATVRTYLQHRSPEATLAGLDALWQSLPAWWRHITMQALPRPVPPREEQVRAVILIMDAMAFTVRPLPLPPQAQPAAADLAAQPPQPPQPPRIPRGAPAVAALVGAPVKVITQLLTYDSCTLARQGEWDRYATQAVAGVQPPQPRQQGQQAAGGQQQAAHNQNQQQQQQAAPGAQQQQPAIQQPAQHQPRGRAWQFWRQHQVVGPATPGQHLKKVFKALWDLPWHNRHKEVMWRLAVNGLQGSGNGIMKSVWKCCCGWVAPPSNGRQAGTDPNEYKKYRSYCVREHVFWSCPVAQAVVGELKLALPGIDISRAHVWLAEPPSQQAIERDVWHVVAPAALTAMDKGRRLGWMYLEAGGGQEGQAQAAAAGHPPPGQAAAEEGGEAPWTDEEIHELMMMQTQAEALSQVEVEADSVASLVGRRAAIEFWCLLHEFAEGGGNWRDDNDVEMGRRRRVWRAGQAPLPADAPFLCQGRGQLRINIPQGRNNLIDNDAAADA